MTKYDPVRAHEWYMAHREERIAKQKEYYESHREQHLAYVKQHRLANRERYDEYSRQQARRFREMREAKAQSQEFLCPCGVPLGGERALDHNHKCCDKTVRSSCRACDREVMHHVCNRIIGMIGDDPVKLRRLADYLERYE